MKHRTKTTLTIGLTGHRENHSRSCVNLGNHNYVLVEPVARGGLDRDFSPIKAAFAFFARQCAWRGDFSQPIASVCSQLRKFQNQGTDAKLTWQKAYRWTSEHSQGG